MLCDPEFPALSGRHQYQVPLRNLLSVIMLALIAGLLQSCASLSRKQCLGGDWRTIGQRDGARGQPLTLFTRHAKSCQRVSVVANRTLWLEGHRSGARHYCTRQNGLVVGNAGRTYHNICEPDQEPTFLYAYRLGQYRHRLIDRRRSLQIDMEGNRDKISDVQDRLTNGEIDEKDARREVRLLGEMNNIHQASIDDVTWEIARFDQKLEQSEFLPLPRP